MPKWSRTVWQSRNKLFGLLAVIAIVLAAVWFYGSGNPERTGSAGDASGNASVGASRNEAQSAEADSRNYFSENGEARPRQEAPDKEKPSSALQPEDRGETSPAESSDKGAVQDTAGGLAARAEEPATAVSGEAAGKQAGAGSQTGEGKLADEGKMADAAEGAALQSVPSGSETAGSSTPPSTGAKPGKDSAKEKSAGSSDSVTLTIVGSPDIGTIMGTIEVDIGDSKTVLDVLKKATRSQKLQMEYTGNGATAYVQGIDNLYEFDKGSGSGWMYSVNGKFPNRSAGIWPLSPGDDIRWLYTEDLGKDLGAGAEDGLWDGKS